MMPWRRMVALTITFWDRGGRWRFYDPATLPWPYDGRVTRAVVLAAFAVALRLLASPVWYRTARVGTFAVDDLKDESLNTSGGLHSAPGFGLVVTQVALSLALLTCAGLFVRSLAKAQTMDPGFDADHVLLATFDLDPMGYTDSRGTAFNRQLLERVKALPAWNRQRWRFFRP